MKVVYHSDDIGLTPHVTQRILEAWRLGMLDGFSVIANGTGLKQVREGLAADSGRPARISAHLNLFEGKALSPSGEIPLLVDASGTLNMSWGRLLRLQFAGSREQQESFRRQATLEWRAQLDIIRDLCAPRPIDCLDSHVHMHMPPFLFSLAADLAVEYGIPEIRIPREVFHISSAPGDSLAPEYAVNIIKHYLLRWCSAKAFPEAAARGLRHPDVMTGVLYTGRMTRAAAEAGLAAARRSGAEYTEIIFHAGRASEAEAASCCPFTSSPKRDEEFEALRQHRGK